MVESVERRILLVGRVSGALLSSLYSDPANATLADFHDENGHRSISGTATSHSGAGATKTTGTVSASADLFSVQIEASMSATATSVEYLEIAGTRVLSLSSYWNDYIYIPNIPALSKIQIEFIADMDPGDSSSLVAALNHMSRDTSGSLTLELDAQFHSANLIEAIITTAPGTPTEAYAAAGGPGRPTTASDQESISGSMRLASIRAIDPVLGEVDPGPIFYQSQLGDTPPPEPGKIPDLVIGSLMRTANGGAEFSYSVANAPLPRGTDVSLYWASGDTFASAIGGPIYSVAAQTSIGSSGPIHVDASTLGTPPEGATHILVVADSPSPTRPSGNVAESSEVNNVLSKTLLTNNATATILSASPAPSTYGQAVTFTATVRPVEVSAGTPAGLVDFFDAGVLIGTAPLNGSLATFTVDTLTAGDHAITAIYKGNGSYDSSASPSYLHRVAKASSTTTATGGSFTYDGTAHAGGSAVVSGAGIVTGAAVLSYAGDRVNAGSYTVIATYPGDANHDASSGTAAITIAKARSTTSLFLMPDPSIYGQQVTIGAIIDPFPVARGLATGFVTFLDGPDILRSIALQPGDVGVVFDTALLTAGTHKIIAVYGGDANFEASASLELPQVVAKAHLTVTAEDKSMAHGDDMPPLTFRITGFVNGETAAVVAGVPTLNTNAGAASAAGRYPITVGVGTLAADNYDFPNLVAGTLTVRPKVVDVRVEWGGRSMSILGLNRTLPFANITALDVVFSDDVDVDAAALLLASDLNPGVVHAPNGFGYDRATHTARWSLPSALDVDRLMLAIDGDDAIGDGHDGVRALADIYMNEFKLWFSVLPGDFNGDRVVNSQDLVGVRNQMLGTGDMFLAVWADLNGDGVVDINDYNATRKKTGKTI